MQPDSRRFVRLVLQEGRATRNTPAVVSASFIVNAENCPMADTPGNLPSVVTDGAPLGAGGEVDAVHNHVCLLLLCLLFHACPSSLSA